MRCIAGVVGSVRVHMQMGREVTNFLISRIDLERSAIAGESPLDENRRASLYRDPSSAGHEESCVNQGGPSSKAKYSLVTDSELVP